MTQSQVRIGWRAYVDLGLDANATAFINASGLTDTTQQSAVTKLVKDLKRFGLWDKIKAFYPFVGGSAESHKWNLKDPRDLDEAYRLTFSGGWTHSANGIKANGSNTSANTFLNLRTVFGATSTQHNLGIYINENPIQSYSVRGFRNDIGANDGSNVIDAWVNSTSQMFFRNISSDNWFTYLGSPSDVSGLNELKRYYNKYYTWTKDGYEIQGTRNTIVTTRYNPNSNVYIGSSSSANRYSSAYISEAFDSMDTFLMYIAVQRFNSSLSRQVGTAISPVEVSTVQPTQSLVTTGMKINFDARSLTRPTERAYGTNGNWYLGITPGNYFTGGDIWTDQSGSGNNGTFWANATAAQGDNRSAQYFIDDYGVQEVRFRDTDNATGKFKLYQHGTSADAVTTTYKGSDTGTYTVGGWVKMNSIHNYFGIMRGEDSQTAGGAWGFSFGGSLGAKLSLGLVAFGGSIQGTASAATVFKADTWYNVYCVWKPGSYIKYYVNGVLQVTNAMTFTSLRTPNGPYGWLIGGGKLGQYHQRGIFGALHIYDRELTAAEVKQNFDTDKDRYNVTYVADTDAHAFVTAAGITNKTQANAVNTLVSALKTAGIWTKMKAIYPFVGGTAESHKFNLKDPRDVDAAYRLVFIGGGTHTSNGYKGNGSNSYADSKFAANILSPGNAHLSFYNRTTTLGSGYISAIQDNASWNTNKTVSLGVGNVNNGGVVGGYFAGGGVSSTTVKTTAWTSLSLLTSTATNSYKIHNAGVVQGSSTANSTNTFSTSSLVIGAHAGALDYIGSYETAFVSFGDGLTDVEAVSFYTAVQAYQTALGRQV